MLELSPARKNKINLSDYNFQQDVENRTLLSRFSGFDLRVLEEILFSPLKTSVKKLAKSLDSPEEFVFEALQTFSPCGLIEIKQDVVLVDKELRKYFEFQILRFEQDFHPDLEFLQGLLRQVPIHVLPFWYVIPRSSNNIFESIIEKYLLTPQVYQRYLGELNFGDSVLTQIIQEVFAAPDFCISSKEVMEKHKLNRTDFEEIMLQLEFNFICFVSYEERDNAYREIITPLHEWRQYLRFLRDTKTAPILNDPISKAHTEDFAFVKDITTLLQIANQGVLSKVCWKPGSVISSETTKKLAPHWNLSCRTSEDLSYAQRYLTRLFEKACLVKLIKLSGTEILTSDNDLTWFDLTLENKALFLYRHPLNHLLNQEPALSLAPEKVIREAEKAVKRVLHGKWVYFDEFIKGVLAPLNDDSLIQLKRCGKQWKYALPSYTKEEVQLIQSVIFEWLFECGMVATGHVSSRKCFSVTPFGRFFFED